ncbi:MAG: hypothetical protein KDH99_00120 [Alcanivoracaceae bacterium]|nr:hypothetical protein [Alcanivoracaceae bacterium]
MKKFSVSVALSLLPLPAMALDMDEARFVEYSARQHCLNQTLWDQPAKLEEALVTLEQEFGIGEDDLDALDELTARYQADAAVTGQIEARARELCP